MLRELAALPLAEDIPIAHNSCRRGPRTVGWRDDRPAEIDWIEAQVRPAFQPELFTLAKTPETVKPVPCLYRVWAHGRPTAKVQPLLLFPKLWPAQDGGDPAVAASPRDIVYTLAADEAAAGAAPRQLAQTELRCARGRTCACWARWRVCGGARVLAVPSGCVMSPLLHHRACLHARLTY